MKRKYWYLLSLVGKDRPGIVAKLSAGLCNNGCNLGDSSMARLGNNFVIMLAINMGAKAEDLSNCIHPHPTLSETIMESADVSMGIATHIYKRPRK